MTIGILHIQVTCRFRVTAADGNAMSRTSTWPICQRDGVVCLPQIMFVYLVAGVNATDTIYMS